MALQKTNVRFETKSWWVFAKKTWRTVHKVLHHVQQTTMWAGMIFWFGNSSSKVIWSTEEGNRPHHVVNNSFICFQSCRWKATTETWMDKLVRLELQPLKWSNLKTSVLQTKHLLMILIAAWILILLQLFLSYISVNWIYLRFGHLVEQNRTCYRRHLGPDDQLIKDNGSIHHKADGRADWVRTIGPDQSPARLIWQQTDRNLWFPILLERTKNIDVWLLKRSTVT